MRRTLAISGWLLIAAFVLTGQYMRHSLQGLMLADTTLRFSLRANHVYLLLFGLTHLLLSMYLREFSARIAKLIQNTGSVALVAAAAITLAAFFLEPKTGTSRPVLLAAMITAIAGTVLHLAAGWINSKTRARHE